MIKPQNLPPAGSQISAQHLIPLIANYQADAPLALQPGKDRLQITTQQQFLQHVNALAQELPNANFALNLCKDRFQFLVVFCALLLKGTTNLLAPNRQPLTLKDIAKDHGDCCYCIFDSPTECEIKHIDISQLTLEPKHNEILAPHNIPSNQLAAIAFTSGSTGKPKPIEKVWGTLATTAQLLSQRLLQAPTALVATVPPQHMYGLETSLLMVLQGHGVMHNSHPFFPADIADTLRHIDMPSALISTPIHLRALIKSEVLDAKNKLSLQCIISATAPLASPLAEACENTLNCPLWEIYGCTEAGSMATRQTSLGLQWELLAGFELQTEKNNTSTTTAPHLVGIAPLSDTIDIIDDCHFLLGARHQDMINVGGKRASIADLNRQLLDIAGVNDGAVFMPNDAKTENRPAAFVVSQLTEQEIRIALLKRIDTTLIPRPIIAVPVLPRNSTGKLTQQAITQLWQKLQDSK